MGKVKYPKTNKEKAYLYLHCMLEIKHRTDAISEILASGAIDLFKHETCYLHLRHICEVISIACLVAQGDYKTHRAFREEYSPPKIFNALRELYPLFFPQPCTMTTTMAAEGHNEHHLVGNNKPDAYQESDITKLWNKAGDYLHRASVNKYLSTSVGFQAPPLDQIRLHVHGLIHLLQQHMVVIRQADGEKKVWLMVSMNDGEGGVIARFLNIDDEGLTIEVDQYQANMVAR